MSCNASSLKNRLACVGAGIGATAAQSVNTIGAMTGRVAQAADIVSNAVGGTVAPVSNRVLAAVDRPTTLTAQTAVVTAAALAGVGAMVRVKPFQRVVGPAEGAMPGVLAGVGVALRSPEEIVQNAAKLKQVRQGLNKIAAVMAASRMAGTLVADLSRNGENERTLTQTRRTFLTGERQLTVEFSDSRLTGLLNRGDRLVSSGSVVSSEGEMVTMGRQSWHRGTTVVKTPGGERTLTHLRSLALPSNSLYFDRQLADDDVAGVVSGQVKAQRLPGYVGEISAAENLAPAWAQAKRALILTRLHWPTPEKATPAWETAPVAES